MTQIVLRSLVQGLEAASDLEEDVDVRNGRLGVDSLGSDGHLE